MTTTNFSSFLAALGEVAAGSVHSLGVHFGHPWPASYQIAVTGNTVSVRLCDPQDI